MLIILFCRERGELDEAVDVSDEEESIDDVDAGDTGNNNYAIISIHKVIVIEIIEYHRVPSKS